MPLIVPEMEVGRRVRRYLKRRGKEIFRRLGPRKYLCRRGRPFEEICRLARERDIDLIVTSTRGNTGLETSRARRYCRTCRALFPLSGACRPRRRSEKERTPTEVAMSKLQENPVIDFSVCSMIGLAYAKKLAKEFDASLVLLHSVHLQYYVNERQREDAFRHFPLVMQRVERAARGQMRDLVRQTDWGGIKVKTSLQIGHVGDQICAGAKDYGADLLVTSSHGTTGLKQILLGKHRRVCSATRSICRPVLVVPSHETPGFCFRPKMKMRYWIRILLSTVAFAGNSIA